MNERKKLLLNLVIKVLEECNQFDLDLMCTNNDGLFDYDGKGCENDLGGLADDIEEEFGLLK